MGMAYSRGGLLQNLAFSSKVDIKMMYFSQSTNLKNYRKATWQMKFITQ